MCGICFISSSTAKTVTSPEKNIYLVKTKTRKAISLQFLFSNMVHFACLVFFYYECICIMLWNLWEMGNIFGWQNWPRFFYLEDWNNIICFEIVSSRVFRQVASTNVWNIWNLSSFRPNIKRGSFLLMFLRFPTSQRRTTSSSILPILRL